MSKGITSTEGLIRKVCKISHAGDESLYYRGHDKDTYKLEPSLYRKPQRRDSEHLLYRELLVANPADFVEDNSTLERLVRMQHYSLPTRLLDITSNPLMALYFTCKSGEGKTGEIIVFKIKREDIKFFDSDTASCIANLARMAKTDKESLDCSQSETDFNKSELAMRLLHFVREESKISGNPYQEVSRSTPCHHDVGRHWAR